MLPIANTPSPSNVQSGSSTEPDVPIAKSINDIPIFKEINYIWLGPTFENFDQTEIQKCVERNPDYRVRLWLDDFSMLEVEGPCGLTRVLPPASLRIYTSGMNQAISSADISKTFAIFVRAQLEYYKVRLNGQLRAHIPTIQKFQNFLLQKNLSNVDLLFLSDFYESLFQAEHQSDNNSLCYPSLQPSEASRWNNLGPEVRLLQWAFFERYRGNYAATSNILRVLLLQTHPGIYVDHRTIVPCVGYITGFRFALTAERTASQCFLASAPNHPYLEYFRDCILQNYDDLLKNDFKCVALDYTTMKKPTDPTDLQSPYITETCSLCGPRAFSRAMKDVALGILGEDVDVSRAAMEEVRVNARAVTE